MSKQIYLLTFEGIELNHLIVGGAGVLNTPLGPDYLRRLARITVDEYLVPNDRYMEWAPQIR